MKCGSVAALSLPDAICARTSQYARSGRRARGPTKGGVGGLSAIAHWGHECYAVGAAELVFFQRGRVTCGWSEPARVHSLTPYASAVNTHHPTHLAPRKGGGWPRPVDPAELAVPAYFGPLLLTWIWPATIPQSKPTAQLCRAPDRVPGKPLSVKLTTTEIPLPSPHELCGRITTSSSAG
jgi:hypothetical protein